MLLRLYFPDISQSAEHAIEAQWSQAEHQLDDLPLSPPDDLIEKKDGQKATDQEDEAPDDIEHAGRGFGHVEAHHVRTGQVEKHEGQQSKVRLHGSSANPFSFILNLFFTVAISHLLQGWPILNWNGNFMSSKD